MITVADANLKAGTGRYAKGNRIANPNAPPSHAVPPPSYTCHRCGEKGHYIQHCPTNDDPDFDQVRAISHSRLSTCSLFLFIFNSP